jgi:hypothetical protein
MPPAATNIVDHQLFLKVGEALKQRILLTVDFCYLQVLEDANIGFADFTPTNLLTHLKSTYGTITPEGIEDNRSLLGSYWNPDDWNPDDPIEDLWLRIKECQRFTTAITEPITSTTCKYPKDGHSTNATVDKIMQGRNSTISSGLTYVLILPAS